MSDEITVLLDLYWEWLKENTTIRSTNGWIEITTPNLDRHNDYLQIYARNQNGLITLTDDGFVLDDLAMSGFQINSPTRQAHLEMTLNGFGVELTEDNRLEIKATRENFPERKHNFVQAMLAITDLFYLASTSVVGVFHDTVATWFDTLGIRYIANAKFGGKSGYDNSFHFVIPRSSVQPERMVRTISRPNRSQAVSFVFSWIDTRETRSSGSRAYAILNDDECSVAIETIEAMDRYDVRSVLWSQRELVQEELAA